MGNKTEAQKVIVEGYKMSGHLEFLNRATTLRCLFQLKETLIQEEKAPWSKSKQTQVRFGGCVVQFNTEKISVGLSTQIQGSSEDLSFC